jgi:glycosyltransferase involved in cell wall biosynthesis
MMADGLVSCIITTYKRPVSVLKRALDSVINQTYQNTEIILVNDGPEEERLDEKISSLLQTYEKNIQYILLPKHQGACSARNAGLKAATGEYVAFLDDDDEWLPEKLEKQVKWIRENDVALVYCSHYYVDESGKIRLIEEPLAKEGIQNDAFLSLLKCNFIGSTSYPLMRTAAVKAVGGFTKGLASSQDHDLWLRIAREYAVYYDAEPLVKLHYSKCSISRKQNKVVAGYDYLLKKYEAIYRTNPEVWNYRLNYLAVCCISKMDIKHFCKYWFQACRIRPFSRNNWMLLNKIAHKLYAWKSIG